MYLNITSRYLTVMMHPHERSAVPRNKTPGAERPTNTEEEGTDPHARRHRTRENNNHWNHETKRDKKRQRSEMEDKKSEQEYGGKEGSDRRRRKKEVFPLLLQRVLFHCCVCSHTSILKRASPSHLRSSSLVTPPLLFTRCLPPVSLSFSLFV